MHSPPFCLNYTCVVIKLGMVEKRNNILIIYYFLYIVNLFNPLFNYIDLKVENKHSSMLAKLLSILYIKTK